MMKNWKPRQKKEPITISIYTIRNGYYHTSISTAGGGICRNDAVTQQYQTVYAELW